jgi:hypothetical protein
MHTPSFGQSGLGHTPSFWQSGLGQVPGLGFGPAAIATDATDITRMITNNEAIAILLKFFFKFFTSFR